ncbi:MAG: hypothetical protein ACREP9_10505, partial [Candidatus Dormibacteraceae bacterium]
MVLLAGVTIALPTAYLALRLILHAVAPSTYGTAGGYSVYVGLATGVLYVFGFIVAATLGATAGSVDLTEGMFRHHVITGRSRMALYLARIPAGLGIILPLIAVGFTIVCAVCAFAATRTLNYNGATVPTQLSRPELVQWARQHPNEVVNNFPLRVTPAEVPNTTCLPGVHGPRGGIKILPNPSGKPCTQAQLRDFAANIANDAYPDYSRYFLSPPVSLIIKTGLWIELEAAIAFLIGLGLASLIGQRTVAVVLMIVLEVILTPLAIRAHLPHMINLQRAIIGAATAHLEPGNLPTPFGGGSPADKALALHETTTVAICVILAWTIGWTALGAWRMAT